MKLKAHEVTRTLEAPSSGTAGFLIYGSDQMRIADARAQLSLSLAGRDAEKDMRIIRLQGTELKSNSAAVVDAVKARGFFDGPRVVIVESAGEAAVQALSAGLELWQPGDATIIVTAAMLAPRSKLRKLFEAASNAFTAPIFDAPMSPGQIDRTLEAAKLGTISPQAREALNHLAQTLQPGDFRQTLEKLALYRLGDEAPLSVEDVEACAPLSAEADLDGFLNIIAGGEVSQIGATLERLYAQGVAPVALCIAAMRHFRTLHRAASDPGGAGAGAGKLRPPLYGPRRDALIRQANHWGVFKLERALSTLLATDLSLRSAHQSAPKHALVERAFIRLALLGRN